ncbi:hypothetical protein CNY89_11925 [Amaricoccus sp. HAR-UPW-R2A-40]|nr:hypothetical protein CNY89_11925 [Amaricoccus sp. HAR-UPW-R2A-40]
MPIDFSSLRKMEAAPAATQARPPADDARVVVLVKLHPGAALPAYLTPRARIAPDLFSVEVTAGELDCIERDPAVASMSLSRNLPMID